MRLSQTPFTVELYDVDTSRHPPQMLSVSLVKSFKVYRALSYHAYLLKSATGSSRAKFIKLHLLETLLKHVAIICRNQVFQSVLNHKVRILAVFDIAKDRTLVPYSLLRNLVVLEHRISRLKLDLDVRIL